MNSFRTKWENELKWEKELVEDVLKQQHKSETSSQDKAMIKNVLKETPYFENKVFKKLSNKEVVNDLSKVVKNGDKTLNRAKYQLIVPT